MSYAAITANMHHIDKSVKRQNNSISTDLSPNQKTISRSAQDSAPPEQDHEKPRTASIVQPPNQIVTSIDISHKREKKNKTNATRRTTNANTRSTDDKTNTLRGNLSCNFNKRSDQQLLSHSNM